MSTSICSKQMRWAMYMDKENERHYISFVPHQMMVCLYMFFERYIQSQSSSANDIGLYRYGAWINLCKITCHNWHLPLCIWSAMVSVINILYFYVIDIQPFMKKQNVHYVFIALPYILIITSCWSLYKSRIRKIENNKSSNDQRQWMTGVVKSWDMYMH